MISVYYLDIIVHNNYQPPGQDIAEMISLLFAILTTTIHANLNVVQIPNTNLNTLLFYTCVTPQVLNQCEEGFTLDQTGIVNKGFSSNFTTINAGAKHNITTLFAVHDTFFENHQGLRKDWKAAWQTLQIQLIPLIESRTVTGFMLGDELLSSGKITLSEFTTALQAIQILKIKYKQYKLITWENSGSEAIITKFKGGIPKELDVISLDDYYMWENNTDTPQSQVDGHRHFYQNQIYPLLKSHQSVFIVPGSFSTRQYSSSPTSPKYPYGNHTYCYNGTIDGCDVYMAEQAQAYAEWAFEDLRVTGLAPWHWDSRHIGVTSPYKEVGVVDMPKTKKAWKSIGEQIVAAQKQHKSLERK